MLYSNCTQRAGSLLACCLVLIINIPLSAECTSGVADGTVTEDARPLQWKSRLWDAGGTNELRYYPAGYDDDGNVDGSYVYSRAGVRSAQNPPGHNYPMIGLNIAGMSTGHDVLDTVPPEDAQVNGYVLGKLATVAEVKAYYAAGSQTVLNARGVMGYIDTAGNATMIENASQSAKLWYDTTAPARDAQTYNGVTLSGYVVRANSPAHWQYDGSDNLSLTGYSADRYFAGMDAVTNNVKAGTLNAKTVLRDFIRHDTIATDTNVSNLVTHGVAPGEDARLTTGWFAMGQGETTIAVPIWVHGLDTAYAASGTNPVNQHMQYDSGNRANSIAYLADAMENSVNESALQQTTLAVESQFYSTVNQTLLPRWRAMDMSDPDTAQEVGEEMQRVYNRMADDAYSILRDAQANGAGSNQLHSVVINNAQLNGKQVQFNFDATDPDPAQASTQSVLSVDFGTGSGVPSGWASISAVDGSTTDATTGISIVITDAFAATTTGGATGGGIYPLAAQQDGMFVGVGAGYTDDFAQVEIRNLDPGKTYELSLFGSRDNANYDRTAAFTIDGETILLDTYNNTGDTATFRDLIADASGTVVVDIENNPSLADGFGYLNVLEISEILDTQTSELSFEWDYGDGTMGTDAFHTYSEAGEYLVTLTATDSAGVSYSDFMVVTVTPEPASLSLLGLGGLALLRKRRRNAS